MSLLIDGIIIGVAGTLAMDIWAQVLHRVGGQALPNWGNVGRWAANLPTVFHDDIGAVPPVKGEVTKGWIVHYAVGVAYGVIFAVLAGQGWLDAPSFLPVWIFGIVTIGAGWFLLQPGMGLGWAASRTPNPWKVRIMGLIAHTVFAGGMFAAAVVLA